MCVCVCVCMLLMAVCGVACFVAEGVSSSSVAANRKQKCVKEVDKIKKRREERRFVRLGRGFADVHCGYVYISVYVFERL